MFNKDKNKEVKKVVTSHKKDNDNNQFNTSDLDDGEFAFMEW